MAENQPITAVVGTGPGLGGALAERFANGGHTVALLSRSEGSRQSVAENIAKAGGSAHGFDCDVVDAASTAAAFERIRTELGHPTVLLYNAGAFATGGIGDLDPGKFESAWRVNCLGGLLTAREVLPAMVEQNAETVLFTGATAALRSSAGFAGFAVGKFGLRALAQSMAREYGPQGVHVAHVLIDGMINTPTVRQNFPDRDTDTFLAPAAIAEQYWQLHQQPRTTWTQELDLRPSSETF
jgi:NAD(P)-dependent dehydrogenase (short-subunit alcohol dehydrogenase family)